MMNNFVLFLNSFLSYLLLFGVFVVLAVVGALIGAKWRKSKNAKEALETAAEESKQEEVTQ